MSGSAERIYALVLRHIYIWRSSIMRLIDSIYWPAVQMVMWGFMTQYLLPQASFVAQAAGVLLSGLLLWEVVVRGNLSLSIAFLEEMWSRNLGHLFVSPIRSWEMATGIIIAALLRTLLGPGAGVADGLGVLRLQRSTRSACRWSPSSPSCRCSPGRSGLPCPA